MQRGRFIHHEGFRVLPQAELHLPRESAVPGGRTRSPFLVMSLAGLASEFNHMKTFKCDACGQHLMFENVLCLNCKHTLGYLPDVGDLAPLEPLPDGEWQSLSPAAKGRRYRMCGNYEQHHVCNWMVPSDDPLEFCFACRLNRTIPDLSDPDNLYRWGRVEGAKRRLIYSVLSLGLPLADKQTDPENGLAFEFLADVPGQPRVLTGHNEGLITLNVAEAESDVREKMRREMGEKYRTMVGHFRHEIGHYYWNVLIRGTERLEGFRKLFGDETADYGKSIERYYAQGAPEDWQDRYISEYASSHPWEDWAETWGNYLHILDTLEAARDAGLILREACRTADAAEPVADLDTAETFEDLIQAWLPLTFALNNINRSLGHADVYPFLLSAAAIEKLKFVHEVVREAAAVRRDTQRPAGTQPGWDRPRIIAEEKCLTS